MGAALDRAEAALTVGRLDLVQRYLREHLAAYPDDSYAHARLATCLGRLGEVNEALTEARLAVRCDPALDFARSTLAVQLYQGGDYRGALAEVNEAIRLAPSAPKLVMLGEVHYQLLEFEETLEATRRALEMEPGFADANSLRGRALARLGRHAEARADVGRALADSPEEVFQKDAAWVFLRAGEYDRAREHFREALRLAPDYEAARVGLAVVLARDDPRYGRGVRLAQWWGRRPRWLRLAYTAGMVAVSYVLIRYEPHLAPRLTNPVVRTAAIAAVVLAGAPLCLRAWYGLLFVPRLRKRAREPQGR